MSARKKEIRENDLYRILYDSASQAMLLIEDGQFVECNASALAMFGCEREQFLGRSPLDFTLPVQPDGSDSAQTIQVKMQAALDGMPQQFEWLCRRLDGTKFDAQIDLHRLDVGDRALIQVSMQDISRRKGAEESLRASQQMLQLMMDNVPQSIFWKDTYLVYLGCNQNFAEDAGLRSPQEVVGKTDFDMPWGEQAELYRADDSQVMASGEPKWNYEEPQNTPDGRQIWLRTSKVP
ncbi:MAG: PAS domain-containing protein, partial [Anaerolineae bacterium]|nr:PAS domain-containing protein [Anaerolineae bacterium]